MRFEEKELLTFDDVILKPRYSTVKSRKDVSIATSLSNKLTLNIPFISSNMDTITEDEMAIAMSTHGGLGILHRYAHQDKIVKWIRKIKDCGFKVPIIPSIGIKPEDKEKLDLYVREGIDGVCLDIAHAHSDNAIYMCSYIKKTYPDLLLIAGNVATKEGAQDLYIRGGADIIKVGVGNGSICSTRLVTGHGIPQLHAILEIDRFRKEGGYSFKMISDGGVKNSGDCVKAFAAGADAIMSGSLFAGTNETPWFENGWTKLYRGMASREARDSFQKVENSYTPEGVAFEVKQRGPVSVVLDQLIGGVKSGCSYSGAHTLEELRRNAVFCKISHNSMTEGRTHNHNG
ncbi:MAG: guanosine monophosphate reductase [Elusimicrobia bacterium]|nr:guanosine monophosphate reductase [Elusimicrobiota bacterium]